MNKNLRLIEKTARLGCVWVTTGDARMPLACNWVEQTPEEARHPKEEQSSAAKAHADLVGLMCWLTPVLMTRISFSADRQADCNETSRKDAGRLRRCA